MGAPSPRPEEGVPARPPRREPEDGRPVYAATAELRPAWLLRTVPLKKTKAHAPLAHQERRPEVRKHGRKALDSEPRPPRAPPQRAAAARKTKNCCCGVAERGDDDKGLSRAA